MLEEGFMREFEGETEGDVVESAFVWLCGWRNWEDRAGVLILAPDDDPPERDDDILSAKNPRRLEGVVKASEDKTFRLASCSFVLPRNCVLAAVCRGVESLDVRRRGSRCSSDVLLRPCSVSDGGCSCDRRG